MNRLVVRGRSTALLLLLAVVAIEFGVHPPCVEAASAVATNIVQLERLASEEPLASHAICLEGDVWWVSRAEDRWVLHDDSGASEIEVELQGARPHAGQRVQLEGHGTIARIGARLRLGVKGPVVDNDGGHSMTEKSGGAYLRRGFNPIRLEWFNALESSGLQVEYEGPGLPRQPIPPRVLFRPSAGDGDALPGLMYQCYTGAWQMLPEVDLLIPVRTGVVSNFDISIAPRPENVALAFEGQLRVADPGLYVFHLRSDDGSRLFVGEPSFSLELIGTGQFPEPWPLAIGQVWSGYQSGAWATLEGRILRLKPAADGLAVELGAGPSRAWVEIADNSTQPAFLRPGARVRVTGFCQAVTTSEGARVAGTVLVPAFEHVQPLGPPSEQDVLRTNALADSGVSLLTKAAEVHRLSRDQAERGYPVRVRGVVTSVLPEHQAFTLQDSTRGLYVEDHSPERSRAPQVGEFLMVEGFTDPSLFAPIVKATVVRCLGMGQMPEPLKPTWDQLLNGSLDAQFVEMEGIVTAVEPEGISMLTRDGVIGVELRGPGLDAGVFKSFENALVRIRGCLFASWDYLTHQVQMGQVRVYDAELSVEEPPPADLFDCPAKSIAALLQFDSQAGAFQRVKVAGQVVGAGRAEHFLMQGGEGLRFQLMDSNHLQVGDLVLVVGFPELFGSASPMLREAVARKVGHAPLPPPVMLSAEDLVSAAHDSTWVQVEGLLVGVRRDSSGLILEIQSGVRSFIARLGSSEDSLEQLPAQTRLRLSGIYVGHGGGRSAEGEITGFELLVNAASDIVVLAKPPWWTLKHLLIVVSLLGCGLAVTMLWVTQLRRQVEQRSAELAIQIKERQHLEYERALEQERTRIAQDLHDELGSGITEISMLAARAKGAIGSDERGRRYLEAAWSKAREMVVSLDEIVWAMDPEHDSVSSLISYFSLYADRFLGLAGIGWRLEGPEDVPHRVVDSYHRHQLFLVFKEALNNVVRHADATEVRVRIRVHPHEIMLGISDNGRGLPAGVSGESQSGLNNMKVRVEKLRGRFEIASDPGQGTTLHVFLPFNQKP